MTIEQSTAITGTVSALGAMIAAMAAWRSATAAAKSPSVAEAILAQQHQNDRESWIMKLVTEFREFPKYSNGKARAQAISRIFDSMPDSFKKERQELSKLAYRRAIFDDGFPAFWQELEVFEGRGPLAGR